MSKTAQELIDAAVAGEDLGEAGPFKMRGNLGPKDISDLTKLLNTAIKEMNAFSNKFYEYGFMPNGPLVDPKASAINTRAEQAVKAQGLNLRDVLGAYRDASETAIDSLRKALRA
jgi:hypothetical protein